MARLGTGTYRYVPFKCPAVGRAHALDPVRSSVTAAAGTADPIAASVPRSVKGAEEWGEVCVNTPSPFFTVAVSLIILKPLAP